MGRVDDKPHDLPDAIHATYCSYSKVHPRCQAVRWRAPYVNPTSLGGIHVAFPAMTNLQSGAQIGDKGNSVSYEAGFCHSTEWAIKISDHNLIQKSFGRSLFRRMVVPSLVNTGWFIQSPGPRMTRSSRGSRSRKTPGNHQHPARKTTSKVAWPGPIPFFFFSLSQPSQRL
jgi:hypothetical protein